VSSVCQLGALWFVFSGARPFLEKGRRPFLLGKMKYDKRRTEVRRYAGSVWRSPGRGAPALLAPRPA
jgi:hypothetical protein